MTAKNAAQDLLPHISYEHEPPPAPTAASILSLAPLAGSLLERVASTDGSITVIAAFGCSVVLNYGLSTSSIQVTVKLQTPVGSGTLGSATLDASHPTVKLGGPVGPFKAEVDVSFDSSTLILATDATICAFAGCRTGHVEVHV